ncbi:MAG: TIGR04086 family membrane protein [Eubacteriales bacterium]|nr:TIGR04086 family membrane protein [Eubacteriales bacterium]
MPTYSTPGAARTVRRRAGRHRQTTWSRLLRGLLSAIGVTLAGVLLFALLMQWLRPSDTVIRIINQLIKLASIFVGALVTVGRGGEKGMLLGAALGFIYMLLGVALYALLSGQQLPFTSYLSDVAMGIAGGGIAGAIISGMRHSRG